MTNILKLRGMIPFLCIAFINAFVDFGHKIVMLSSIHKFFTESQHLLYTTLINALMLLPFVLVFTPSGFLADRFPKNKVIRISAWFSVLLSIIITICYFSGSFWTAFYLTFLMALQSALYSPSKFGYIKDLVGNEQLTQGNSWIQAVSIISMLIAMAFFSFIFEKFFILSDNYGDSLQSVAFIGFILIAFACIELVLAYRLPTFKHHNPLPYFNASKYITGRYLKKNLQYLLKEKNIWLCILGISLFWCISQLYIVAFPNYAKVELGIDNTFYINLILGSSGLGIIAGSFVVSKFSKNYLELGLVPFGAIIVFISSLLLFVPNSLFPYSLLFFFFGGGMALFIVPLNSLIQFQAKSGTLGKILAGNNFIQTFGMLITLFVTTCFAYLNLNSKLIFALASILTLIGTIYVISLMPFLLVRLLTTLAFNQRYRLIVEGFKNIPEQGGALLLGNHISFIDWAIVQMAIPRRVHFVIEHSIYSKWYIKIFLDRFGIIPVSSSQSKTALQLVADYLKSGKIVCLFPEGTISRHGHLNEFKGGYELSCKNLQTNEAVIIPFYIRGLWGSAFSRSSEQFQARNRSFFAKRNITIAFGEQLDIHTPKEKLKNIIFDLSFKAWKSHCESMPTIGQAWIATAKNHLLDIAIVDSMSGEFTFRKLLALSLMLSSKWRKTTKTFKYESPFAPSSECIGILLPASFASSLCNLSILVASKVAVNLNFTAGIQSLTLAIQSANIQRILTSKKFLQKLSDKGIHLEFDNVEMIYMEDLVTEIKSQKITFISYLLMVTFLPTSVLKNIFSPQKNIHDVATILFSSGSEGTPKGIMLNHLNIMSNIDQISDVLCVQNDDAILSSLPPFHAFGLTATTFLPLLAGVPSITHADPTDSLGIAKAIAKNDVTIMCGTSTFLNLYTRSPKLDGVMFESLRIVVSGAEKLKEEIRNSFETKFHRPILEGYGATETTPVVSVNLPSKFDAQSWQLHIASKIGSVGMPLPGTTIRIVDPESLESLPIGEEGLILVGGHQVMVGYLNDPQKTQEVIVELDGIRWYKTGDKGKIDEDGFLYITDRYSRFAKIGGEMVSLGAVEEAISKVLAKEGGFEEVKITATSLEDSKKGEVVVMLIQASSENLYEESLKLIKSSNALPPIYKPSKFARVEQIPILGSGKFDLKGIKTLAKEIFIQS